jgi:hypothetical protein
MKKAIATDIVPADTFYDAEEWVSIISWHTYHNMTPQMENLFSK